MPQLVMTTEAKTLKLELFPLSPDAVRKLRALTEVTDTGTCNPSQNDRTTTHSLSCSA